MAETSASVHHLTHIVKPKREVVSPPSIFMIGFVKYWHRGNEIGNLDLWLHHHEKKDLGKFPSQLGGREHLSIRPQVFVRTFPFSSRVQPISIFVLKTCSFILFIICVFKIQSNPKANNIKFYGSHITRGCPKSTQSENLSIIGGKMTILWPFSPFLHPPPLGPYLANPSELGPVLWRASRGHIWLPYIQKLSMGKSLFVRNWCSKLANFHHLFPYISVMPQDRT